MTAGNSEDRSCSAILQGHCDPPPASGSFFSPMGDKPVPVSSRNSMFIKAAIPSLAGGANVVVPEVFHLSVFLLVPETLMVPRPKEAPGHGTVALSPEGSSHRGFNLAFGLRSLSRPPHLPVLPHLRTDVRLQDLNEIKTDSVEPCSGLSYKGFTQLSLSEFILSASLSSSGCTLLISFRSLRRLRIKRGKYLEHLHMRTNWARGRPRARCVTPEE